MDNLTWNVLLTAGATVITAFLTYLGTKKNIEKDHRSSLSDDEREFRKELTELVASYRNQQKEMSEEMSKLVVANRELELQVLELSCKNKSLQQMVEKLEEELHKLIEIGRNLGISPTPISDSSPYAYLKCRNSDS